jgi:hypothetical protein
MRGVTRVLLLVALFYMRRVPLACTLSNVQSHVHLLIVISGPKVLSHTNDKHERLIRPEWW